MVTKTIVKDSRKKQAVLQERSGNTGEPSPANGYMTIEEFRAWGHELVKKKFDKK